MDIFYRIVYIIVRIRNLKEIIEYRKTLYARIHERRQDKLIKDRFEGSYGKWQNLLRL